MCVSVTLSDGKATEMWKVSLSLVLVACIFLEPFLFRPDHFNKAENEVSLERKKKEEDEKPFKDVAGTESDVRKRPVGLQYLSRSLVSVM